MNICGIICELNPAHNGHKYIFDEAKRLTGAEYTIAIMSGDYVQRGEPALLDKHVRTRMALSLGADACIELPTIMATGSAQYFARGAVAIANLLGINYLVFGSECGDLDRLSSEEFTSPNDVLASEYIKAIKYLGSDITPVAVSRIGTDYNDQETKAKSICSASYIRAHLGDTASLSDVMPGRALSLLESAIATNTLVSPSDISSQIFYKLNSEISFGYNQYFDVYDDLSKKIIKNLNSFTDFEAFCHVLKSKDIAYSHIKRALLHILLGLTGSQMDTIKANGYITYIRLLGFRKEATALLAEIKKTSAAPIISKLADASTILDSFNLGMLENDIAGSHLYSMLSSNHVINEYTRQIVIY